MVVEICKSVQNHTRKDPECHKLSLVWGSGGKDQQVSKKADCEYWTQNIPDGSEGFWKSTRPHSRNSLAKNLSAVFLIQHFADHEYLQTGLIKFVKEVSQTYLIWGCGVDIVGWFSSGLDWE